MGVIKFNKAQAHAFQKIRIIKYISQKILNVLVQNRLQNHTFIATV